MSHFPDLSQQLERELFPGVTLRTAWGEKLMMSFVRLAPGALVPPHDHPHEQMGLLLEGELEFTIADEAKSLRAGEIWCIPGGVTHSVRAGEHGAYALDLFAPPREEYKVKSA